MAYLSSDRISQLRGWRRGGLAFAAGALATTAMPPFHAVLALWIAFPVLLWLLDGCRTARQSAVTGWCFAFGHYLTGFFWIANAFYVDADTFGVFAIPAVGGLCAGLALYGAAAALPLRWIDPERDAMPDERVVAGALRAAALAIAWAFLEWVRSWVLSGFPWNPMASVWTAWPAMIQVTALVGTYGLSFITVLCAALAAVLGPAPRLRRAMVVAGAPVVGLVLIGVGGAVRMETANTANVAGLKLRIVQPNIPQADKWRPGLREQHLQDYIRMSRAAPSDGITHVIWGEAAVTFALDRDDLHRQMVTEIIPPRGYLITGVPRATWASDSTQAFYNSMIAIAPNGDVAAVYDKVHLVPFGEYMPLRGLIPFRKLTEGTSDFSAGTRRSIIALPGLPPFAPLICYEAIFSGDVLARGNTTANEPRAGWILNITNDTWFGDSTGPYQHLAAAQLRAVEEGLPLVRAATSGVSAIIDPYGRLVTSLGLNRSGILDGPLPTAAPGLTLFRRAGNLVPLALFAIASLGLWAATHRRRRQPGSP